MIELPNAQQRRELAELARRAAVDNEVTSLGQPDNIPDDVWELIQDNGRLATERLNEILISPRFHRLRAGDQAKLIKLAQDRAYGIAAAPRDLKPKGGRLGDEVARQLNSLEDRTTLPEYKHSTTRQREGSNE